MNGFSSHTKMNEKEIKVLDGVIDLDTPFAREIGFTSDKFSGYLYKRGKDIWISLIESLREGEGNLSALFRVILEKGFKLKVPTPFSKMEGILRNHGFKKTRVFSKAFEDMVDVWGKDLREEGSNGLGTARIPRIKGGRVKS